MKKVLTILSVILVACILLAGIFSAGLFVGRIYFPQNVDATTPAAEAPLFIDPIFEEKAPGSETLAPESSNPAPTFETPTIEVPPPSEGLSDLFVPFWEAWDIVHQHYVDQPVDDQAMMEGAIQGMVSVMDVYSHTLGVEIPGIDEYNIQSSTPEELQDLFMPFWQSWALVHSIDNSLLVQGAIRGMLDSLGDPHTSYMDPVNYDIANTQLEGTEEYEGIGAWVDISKDYLTIITPFPDSPAEIAGLQPGDKILAIDGEDMTGIDGELVRQRVLGPAGTTIKLTIFREGMESFDVDVTRASVIVPSVDGRMLDGDIAYVRIFLFGEKTADEVHQALQKLLDENPTGLILDLRYNGGGSVDSAVAIASEFINEGVIFHEVYGDGSRDTYESSGNGLATSIPMVVLVNEGTASASEIVSGAIQDYGRAPLVGTTTFGKGSVQYWIPLSNNQGAVRVTIAHWITPKERQIHKIGLNPDIPIVGIPQTVIDEGFDISALGMESDQIIILSEEDVRLGRDVQLDKAIEILQENQ
jgi:carboxyl-terminal processing protease